MLRKLKKDGRSSFPSALTTADVRPHRESHADDLQEANVIVLDLLTAPPEQRERLIDQLRRKAAAVEGSDDYDDGETSAAAAYKRSPIALAGPAEIRSPRDIHPIYLGIGQNAASAALNTYASLMADDKRRENADMPGTNPVRFIGR